MSGPTTLGGWPDGSAMTLMSSKTGEVLATEGDAHVVRPWASVTKLVVALAVAREFQLAEVDLAAPAGPLGSTVAHLLAHASGLGLEASDPVTTPGTRRIYSNIGVDLAIAAVTKGRETATWLHATLLAPLGVDAELRGRASSGLYGSLDALVRLASAWLNPELLVNEVRDRFTSPFMAQLAGVVPGFGRFVPCPWGLGPEIHGDKNHWMGQRFSPSTFGHFGQSGSLALIDPVHSVVLAAVSGTPFGPWARERWPHWSDEIFDRFVAP